VGRLMLRVSRHDRLESQLERTLLPLGQPIQKRLGRSQKSNGAAGVYTLGEDVRLLPLCEYYA